MSAAMVMPRYKCHKEVWALAIQMVMIDHAIDGDISAVWLVPVDKRYDKFEVSVDWYKKHDLSVGGYYVVYSDGYRSWSPAKAFEEGYTLLD